jgi:predicted nucleic acid-binding protein
MRAPFPRIVSLSADRRLVARALIAPVGSSGRQTHAELLYFALSLSYADAVGAAVATREGVELVASLDNDLRVMGFTVES